MSISLYYEFMRPLTAEELSTWAGVSFTDYDLSRAEMLFELWHNTHYIHWITVTALFDMLPLDTRMDIIRAKLANWDVDDDIVKGRVARLVVRDYIDYQYAGYNKGQMWIDVSGVIWNACNNGPYNFLYNMFGYSHDPSEQWQNASTGSHPFRQYIYDNYPREVYKGREYMAGCGSFTHNESMRFAWNHMRELNGAGIFPIEVLDKVHWG
jgi:hypothetical protein